MGEEGPCFGAQAAPSLVGPPHPCPLLHADVEERGTDDFRAPDAPAGYVYSNFWGVTSAEQQSSAPAAHQGDAASVGIYITHRGTGTYLFPPNPNW